MKLKGQIGQAVKGQFVCLEAGYCVALLGLVLETLLPWYPECWEHWLLRWLLGVMVQGVIGLGSWF